MSKKDVRPDLLPKSKYVVQGLWWSALRCDQSFPAVGDVTTKLHNRHTDELVPMVIRQNASSVVSKLSAEYEHTGVSLTDG
jgi:hypothetical protein